MANSSAYSNIIQQIETNIRNLNNFRFLVDTTSLLLSSSLDYEETLSKVANSAVPQFADWCTVHILAGTEHKQLAVAHADPTKVALARKLQEEYPSDPNAKQGVFNVMRTGESELVQVIPKELLMSAAKDDRHREILLSLGLKSYMCVPLRARKKVIGAITFVFAESGKVYSEDELAIVEDLARIAGIIIENALLFKEAQEEIEKRQQIEQSIIELNKSLEDKVIERTTELRRSNRELQDFAYVASHDLQEPLRKIQSFGNLLLDERECLSDDGKVYVERMLDAAGRMRVLIDDLLSYSRVTTKGQPFISVDLSEIVSDVLEDMETRIADSRAQITYSALPHIEGDATQLRQLVQNLISNSLKFHKQGVDPVVSIVGEEFDDGGIRMLQITFRDNGIGLDEKYQDRIFTIFEKLHGRHEYEGTGIGLAVVKKIVERHKGLIRVKSTLGEGSTFIITLPMTHTKGDSQ